MRPIIINNFLHSAGILGDACEKLRHFSVEGARLNRQRIDEMVDRSLMLVTALSPVIGYDKASAIAHKANDEDLTLKEAALKSGYRREALRRDRRPERMVGHGGGGTDLAIRALPFVLSVIAGATDLIGFSVSTDCSPPTSPATSSCSPRISLPAADNILLCIGAVFMLVLP
jgi:hypothetical protein